MTADKNLLLGFIFSLTGMQFTGVRNEWHSLDKKLVKVLLNK